MPASPAVSGEVPATFQRMGANACRRFIGALGLTQCRCARLLDRRLHRADAYAAPPELIRRLVLAGTGPRAGEAPQDSDQCGRYGALTDPETGEVPIETFLWICSSARPERARRPQGPSWARRHMRERDVDPPASAKQWRRSGRQSPSGVKLVANALRNSRPSSSRPSSCNGHNDIMVPTINSFSLSQNIPNAQLIIYPDAGHGALLPVSGVSSWPMPRFPEWIWRHVDLTDTACTTAMRWKHELKAVLVKGDFNGPVQPTRPRRHSS